MNTKLDVEAYQFQSARAALYAYLSATKVKTLYVPNYICDSIFPALESLNIEVEFYSINEQLLPEKSLKLIRKSCCKVLLVNYFGLLNKKIKELITSEPELYVIDNSQALFCEHIEGTTSIYSPRKFLGIPDGGLLRTSKHINMPKEFFDASKYTGHLLLRASGYAPEGYTMFLDAEQALESFTPKRMSVISEYLIKCTDIRVIKEKRQRNYELLYTRFNSLNQLQLPIHDQIPLCYPLKLAFKVDQICKQLIDKAIYLPRYWCSKYSGEVGQDMFETTLFLPIDERLDTEQIELIIESVNNMMALK
ncbi:hypothetical protein CW748_12700 [Alteromonadales bacterium alter-6D02]|nr:hypothetical protein CW748_12700 [Alteromonadales bacterium alter-6D02]